MQKYQHFFFEVTNSKIIKAQLVTNGTYIEFNLLKTRIIKVFEITKKIKSFSILILIPPPLNYKRQEYLYYNIHPFVRDKFKDITCSQPIYTSVNVQSFQITTVRRGVRGLTLL